MARNISSGRAPGITGGVVERAFGFPAIFEMRIHPRVREYERPVKSELTEWQSLFCGSRAGRSGIADPQSLENSGAAEVVLHDALVPPEILRLARTAAVVCDVGKRCGQKSIRQEEIHALLIGYASARPHRRAAARRRSADLWARRRRSDCAARRAGIDFEIVPGVTAASAAAAAAGFH